MRLGQLARQLEINSDKIVEYLATRNISIDPGTNTRLEDAHVELIIRQFSPNSPPLQESAFPEVLKESTDPVETDHTPSEPSNEIPDLIKAPKVELPGLKVVGKIDLPEKKPKEGEVVPEGDRKAVLPTPQPYRGRRENRPGRNPLAAKRESEQRERQEKLEAERELEKQKRTEYYLKRIKQGVPTKAVRMVEEDTIEMPPLETARPTTLWGRFMRWLTT